MTHLDAAIKQAFLDLDEILKKEDEFVTKQDTSGCTAICAVITPTHVVVSGLARPVTLAAIPIYRPCLTSSSPPLSTLYMYRWGMQGIQEQ